MSFSQRYYQNILMSPNDSDITKNSNITKRVMYHQKSQISHKLVTKFSPKSQVSWKDSNITKRVIYHKEESCITKRVKYHKKDKIILIKSGIFKRIRLYHHTGSVKKEIDITESVRPHWKIQTSPKDSGLITKRDTGITKGVSTSKRVRYHEKSQVSSKESGPYHQKCQMSPKVWGITQRVQNLGRNKTSKKYILQWELGLCWNRGFWMACTDTWAVFKMDSAPLTALHSQAPAALIVVH